MSLIHVKPFQHMSELMTELIGEGKDLTILQMALRGMIVFIAAFLMIRLSGRRSFSMGMPFDNIVSILLGAVLSRAVAGASPFIPTLVCCALLVTVHRILAWAAVKFRRFGTWLDGDKILIFRNGKFLRDNMKRALISEDDIHQGVRKSLQTEDLSTVEKVYMERNGEICAVKKPQ